jgi:UDP-2,3-diacylglucosamine hydrolase
LEESAVFTSDLHLAAGRPARTGRFVNMLMRMASRSDTGERSDLWLLGDVFEFWHEWLTIPPRRFRPVTEAVARAVRSGCRVRILAGNRDFLLGRGFARTGAEVIRGPVSTSVGALRICASHGDELCTLDRRYQFWRGIVRSLPVRALASLAPTPLAFAAARVFMAMSEGEKERKGLAVLDIQDAAAAEVAARGFDLVVAGHVHTAARRGIFPEGSGGRRAELITLPAWTDDAEPQVLVVTPSGARFARVSAEGEVLA